MRNRLIEDFIDLAIREDLGDGDHSSLACIPEHERGTAQLLVKEEGIIAGIEISARIFKRLDKHSCFERKIDEGSRVSPGDVVFLITSNILSLLQAERLILNIMQRMSGIATQTSLYVEKLKGLKTKVLDTRKTTPGMRLLEKEAVRIGGGENHRFGLFDMILLKDNHIDFVGDIQEAIIRAKKYLKRKNKKLKLEVEARSLDDVRKILAAGGVNYILLDNFSVPDTRAAVEIVAGKCKTESSGGITLENLRSYAECGVDYISVGALTHQIKSIDLSLKAIDY